MTAIFLIYVDSKEKKKKQMLPLSFASCFGEIDKIKIFDMYFDMPVLFFEKKSLTRDGTLNGLMERSSNSETICDVSRCFELK